MTRIGDVPSRSRSGLPTLYTPEEVADALRVSVWWVKNQARRGCVDAAKVAGAWRFTGPQVQQLLDLHTTSAAPDEDAVIPARRQGPAPAEHLTARLPRRLRTA